MAKIRWIYNKEINNFLQKRGFMPIVEEQNRSGYRTCQEFWSVLEDYQIFLCFKNRQY